MFRAWATYDELSHVSLIISPSEIIIKPVEEGP